MGISWASFLALRALRVERGRAAAQALMAGDRLLALGMLVPWGLSAEHGEALLDRLVTLEPRLRPPPWLLFAALEAAATLPAPGVELSTNAPVWAHRRALQDRCRRLGLAPTGPPQRLAWALEELSFAAEERARRHIDPWSSRDWQDRPKLDRHARRLWQIALFGAPFGIRAELEHALKLWVDPLARAFTQEVASVGGTLRRHADLKNSFFWRLFMPDAAGGPSPTLLDLAFRVLETAGPGPVDALSRRVPDEALGGLASCAVERGHAMKTADLLAPGLQRPSGRATALWAGLLEDRAALERALDLHTVSRLLSAWTRADRPWAPDPSWGVVQANRGRARARLRALLIALRPEQTLRMLLDLPQLFHRTRDTVRWLGTDLARLERPLGYPLREDLPPLPPCPLQEPPPAPLEEDASGLIDTWLLLVALKGRWETLMAWTFEGQSFSDGGWGRLLCNDLPGQLTDLGVRGPGQATYDRLRLYLRSNWAACKGRLRLKLEVLGTRHRLKRSGHQAVETLRKGWHADVPFPRGSLGPLLQNALSVRLLLEEPP